MKSYSLDLFKNWKGLVFCSWHHNRDRFTHFWPRSLGPEHQPNEKNIWLSFIRK